ncbi:hypothetical protein [Sphingomonas sp. MMS24-J13]|uniref:hypothetical protein n=1 Tax=Sphingomonas sp. MMS24-J13 TaxID=3238686 RepID=UPI00384DBC5A
MLHAFAAIADFMLILLTSALWVGAGIVGAGLIGLGAVGGAFLMARRWWRLR